MFTVLCRHVHSDLQNTEVFRYVIGKSNIIKTWNYISVLNIKGKHIFTIYILSKHLPTGRALVKMYRVVPQTKRGKFTICNTAISPDK